jgi:hypothetical protein
MALIHDIARTVTATVAPWHSPLYSLRLLTSSMRDGDIDSMPIDYQIGFTSPSYRENWRRAKDEPKKKRNPIGFVHFGEPEEEPCSYLDEYIQFKLDGVEEFDDELLVGFTANWRDEDLPF